MRDYEKEYTELAVVRDDIKNKIESLKEDYAKENCPFTVGQEVKILGYVHSGKQGIIENIRGAETLNALGWIVYGTVLKKNGEKSVFEFSFNDYNYKL